MEPKRLSTARSGASAEEMELGAKAARSPSSSSSSSSSSSRPRRLPAEVRRARHRERMQRLRMAEKESIEVKRVEVERLTRELETAVAKLEKECGVLGRDGEAKLQDTDLEALSGVQETITEENRRLTERFHEWQQFMKLLGVEHERLPKIGTGQALGSELGVQEGSGSGRWIVFSENEPVIFFEPLARSLCHELAFKAYQRMQELQRGPGARTLHDEAFGWKVYFSMQSDGPAELGNLSMQHRFTKRISTVSPGGGRISGDSLARETWKIVNSPELYKQMYRNPLVSRILQHVDAHTCVLMRTYPDENSKMYQRFVSLVAQVQDCVIDESPDPNGGAWQSFTRRRVTVLSSIMDPDLCFPRASTRTANPAAKWMRDGLGYLSFTEIDDESSIEIEYGGILHVDKETAMCPGVPIVAMNMGEALVRWEQLVTPMRTLTTLR